MDNLDMILFIAMFSAAVICALLVFHGLGLLIVWRRDRKLRKKMHPHGTPFWWRT